MASGNHDTIADMKAGPNPVVSISIDRFKCNDRRSEFKEKLIHVIALTQ